jgi:hypothetical protein
VSFFPQTFYTTSNLGNHLNIFSAHSKESLIISILNGIVIIKTIKTAANKNPYITTINQQAAEKKY